MKKIMSVINPSKKKSVTSFFFWIGPKTLLDLSEEDFKLKLTQYLFSPGGSKYRALFKYKEDIKCGKSAPDILVGIYVSRIWFGT